MSQVLQNRTVNTFVKGLITEATEATFPPDASVDENNCVLDRDGSRRRRLGLEVEADSNSFLTNFNNLQGQITLYRWDNVADSSELTFLVMQVGSGLRFYDISANNLGTTAVATVVNLADYSVGNGQSLTDNVCEVASLNGYLYVTHPAIDPIYLEYNPDTNTITTTVIRLQVRDFDWQGDISTYSQTRETISSSNRYDYFNVGWSENLLNQYKSSTSFFPPFNLPWFSGKDASGDFDPAEFDKIYAGNTLTVNGHYILNFFERDRTSVSGIPGGLDTQYISARPRCVEAYAGRIFYAGIYTRTEQGRVLFSQTIESVDQSGLCYQSADPTSEDFSDLVATDGGVINIPEALNIKKLFVFGPTLMVFAENGIWSIRGPDEVFSPTEFYVTKVSAIGIDSPQSFVDVDGVPFWWSNTAIHTLSVDQVSGSSAEQNISLRTIQRFFDEIGKEQRSKVRAAYDVTNKKIFWSFPSINDTEPSKRSRVLILDVVIQAFYPWQFETPSNSSFVVAPFFYEGAGTTTVLQTVESNELEVKVNDDTVCSSVATPDYTNVNDIRWIVWDGTGVNVARTTGTTFLDWGSVDYNSYAEAGYDFAGSMTLRKNAPVVTVLLGITEEGFTGDDTTGYNLIRPSSCLLSVYWDMRTSPSTLKPKEVYRLTRNIIVDTTNLSSFNYPYQIIQTRNQVRGRGRSMRLRFESSTGKDFHLLGYEVIQAVNRTI